MQESNTGKVTEMDTTAYVLAYTAYWQWQDDVASCKIAPTYIFSLLIVQALLLCLLHIPKRVKPSVSLITQSMFYAVYTQ